MIPSARGENLVRCVGALFDRHPGLPPNRVIVIDNGARKAESLMPQGMTWIPGVKPFIFSRNVNLGVAKAWEMGGDFVVIMGDDVLALTPSGFEMMVQCMTADPTLGILSAAICGLVGNGNQNHDGTPGAAVSRSEDSYLCFVCVMITRRVWEKVGPLDEQFVGYGYEDNDYSNRVRQAGFKLGVLNTCAVNHRDVPSMFRSGEHLLEKFEENRQIYLKKWGAL